MWEPFIPSIVLRGSLGIRDDGEVDSVCSNKLRDGGHACAVDWVAAKHAPGSMISSWLVNSLTKRTAPFGASLLRPQVATGLGLLAKSRRGFSKPSPHHLRNAEQGQRQIRTAG